MADLTPEQSEALAQSFARRAQSADAIQRSLAAELALLNEESEVYQSIGAQVDTNNKLLEIEAQMAANQINALKAQLEEKIKIGEADEEALKTIGEQIAAQQRLLEASQRRVESSNTLRQNTSNIVTTLTGIDDTWKTTFVGSFMESLSSATSLSQVVGDLRAGLAANISVANAMGSAFSKVEEATLSPFIGLIGEQETALANFNKFTGVVGGYNSMIVDIERSNKQFGISTQDSAEAVSTLFTNLNLFSGMAPKAQKEMAALVAQLDAVGVSSETSATNIELGMRVLGMSASEAQNLQLELLATAEALALPPQMVAEGFAKTAPQLAAHGKRMISVFKDLAAESKATGLAMDDLLGFASQFNTYEGAAQITADFNHLLGGAFLNSLELLNATEEERIDLIQDAMKASGQSFDAMDAHTKRAIAHHLGLKDVAEASRLLNPEMIGLSEAEKKARIEQDKLAKRAETTQSIMQKLQNVVSSLAVSLQPLVNLVSSVVMWITELNDKTTFTVGGFKLSLIPAIIIGITALRTLGLVIRLVTTAQIALRAATVAGSIAQTAWNIVKGIGNFLTGASTAATVTETGARVTSTAALLKQAAAQKLANARSAAGLKAIIAFAGAVALMGVGVGAAAAGIGFMAEGFSKLNNDQINAIVLILGGLAAVILLMGLLMLAPVGQAATLGILALGAAILLLGAGIAVASLGLSVLLSSISQLNPEQILAAGSAFVMFAGALTPLLPWVLAGPLLAAALLAIGVAALMIGGGFSLAASSIEKFDSILSNISDDSIRNLMAIADEVERIVDAVNDLSVIKASLFENIVSKLVPEGAAIEPTGAAARVTTAAVEKTEASARVAVQTTPKGADSQSAQMRPINISVKIDEKEIAKIAWEEIQKEFERVGGRRIQGPRVR